MSVDDAAPDNPLWIKVRATAVERARWQALASGRGVSLSELIRSRLDGTRLRSRREPPPVAPDLLRELARIGNNLNQLAHAANRREPLTATALLTRLVEIDRELSVLRTAHQRQDAPPTESGDGGR
ncbi:MAG: MobC family plasmid mobilization relaxosome protein [Jhaorihella sp.]